jgi:hypothetical protein
MKTLLSCATGLLLLLVLTAPKARAQTYAWWEFTIHINTDIIHGHALEGSDVYGSWAVDLDAVPVEQYFTYNGWVWHTYTYRLGPLTLYLPAIDDIWTYPPGWRYIVALPDDTYCTHEGPVHCATWDDWMDEGFPNGVEIHAERRPDGSLIPPSIGAVASLWAGQGCLICGKVTDNGTSGDEHLDSSKFIALAIRRPGEAPSIAAEPRRDHQPRRSQSSPS